MNDGLTERERSGIRSVLAAFPKVERAVLFGSRALGTSRRTSDVDLALEGKDLRLEDLVKLLARISELNLAVDPDFLIRADIKSPDLEEHIRKHGFDWYCRAPSNGKGLGVDARIKKETPAPVYRRRQKKDFRGNDSENRS